MLPSRRTALLALAAPLAGCSALSREKETDGLPSPDQVKSALRDLVRQTGRDSFQQLDTSSSSLRATLLLDGGKTQQWTRRGAGWTSSNPEDASILTSPVALPYAKLPIGALPKYAQRDVQAVYFTVDYVGVIQVSLSPPTGEQYGMLVDGSGRVPTRSISEPAEVTASVTEVVKRYGRAAERIGSFNGFVHVDLNHPKATGGIRVVRYPTLAARARLADVKPFAENLLFDPSGFDPSIALQHKATVAQDANVQGKVWDWEFRRPKAGAQPVVSYGIGPDVPSTRVWLDARGGIDRVVDGECANKSGWCPA